MNAEFLAVLFLAEEVDMNYRMFYILRNII